MIVNGLELADNRESLAVKLAEILERNKNKRIVVVGTTCTGKSTFLKQIGNAHDMDDLIFPQLSQEEKNYVCQNPWTEEIGKTMTRLVKEKVKIKAGEPVFGTVVLYSDLIIELIISDELLRQRTAFRGVDFQNAKNMQRQIGGEVKQSGLPVIKFNVG